MNYRKIPNLITLGRIALTFPILLLFAWVEKSPAIHLLILALTLACVISDFLDGRLARRWNCVSDFGKIYDPLADKMLILLYLPLVRLQMIHFLPVAILLARDFLSTHFRGLSNSAMAALTSGKIKTAVNLGFLCLLIAAIPVENGYLFVFSGRLQFLYWLSGISISTICIWSGVDYWYQFQTNNFGK